MVGKTRTTEFILYFENFAHKFKSLRSWRFHFGARANEHVMSSKEKTKALEQDKSLTKAEFGVIAYSLNMVQSFCFCLYLYLAKLLSELNLCVTLLF